MTLATGFASVVPLTGGGHQAGAMGGPFAFAPFGFFLLLLLVGAVGYLLVRSTRRGDAEREVDSALQALRRRYANGEIDDEEFERRKERLRG